MKFQHLMFLHYKCFFTSTIESNQNQIATKIILHIQLLSNWIILCCINYVVLCSFVLTLMFSKEWVIFKNYFFLEKYLIFIYLVVTFKWDRIIFNSFHIASSLSLFSVRWDKVAFRKFLIKIVSKKVSHIFNRIFRWPMIVFLCFSYFCYQK